MTNTRYASLAIAAALLLAAGSCTAAETALSVRDFGAKGDGKALDTRAIQSAIDTCAKRGGGTVVVPAGTYLSAPIFLKSNITLRIEPGAVLLGSRKWDDYPVVRGRWEGVEREHKAALITGANLENVTIEGRGVIDGQGDAWWTEYKRLSKLAEGYAAAGVTQPPAGEEEQFRQAQLNRWPRPRLISLINCRNVAVRGISLRNSPSWTLHPVYCENVTIDGLTVDNPGDSPNTDGINPDSCRLVRISNCSISVGDDCITIKSGKGADGRKVGKPCEDIAITNCIMREGHGGVVIGSEMSGGVRNVVVSNCVFDGTTAGIRIKTGRGRGGVVENVSYSNIVMRGILKEAIILSMAYTGRVDPVKPEPVTEETPTLRNISIANIRADGARIALLCEGLPESPVSGVSLSNVRISATNGMRWTNASGVDMTSVTVGCAQGPALAYSNCREMDTSGFRSAGHGPDHPAIATDTSGGGK